jgi:hypothetical protein
MNNLTLKDQGNLGEATAILFYAERGDRVSKPLFENSPYDLIVDDGISLKRVQVKTTRYKAPSGKYRVNLRTFGGNRSGTGKVKKISAEEVDLVFVLVEDGRMFELQPKDFDGRNSIAVG